MYLQSINRNRRYFFVRLFLTEKIIISYDKIKDKKRHNLSINYIFFFVYTVNKIKISDKPSLIISSNICYHFDKLIFVLRIYLPSISKTNSQVCYLHMIIILSFYHRLFNHVKKRRGEDIEKLNFLSHGRHSHSIFLLSRKKKISRRRNRHRREKKTKKKKEKSSHSSMTFKYLIYTSIVYIHESNNNVCSIYNK